MPWLPKARCYKCKRYAEKQGLCTMHRNQYYGREYRRLKAAVLLPWIAEHGGVCPGFNRAEHLVPIKRLTVDHIIPVSRGGSTTRGNLTVLCLECNSAKAGHA